jgi:uroporphyrinogen decarboxylase
MKELSSRERVIRTFNRREADKLPVDFGGTVVTCMDLRAHIKLKKHFGIEDQTSDRIIDYTMGTVEPCERLGRMFGSDFRRISLNFAPPKIIGGTFENGFGMIFKKAEPHEYFDLIYSPMQNAGISDISNLKTPDPDDPSLYFGLSDKAKDLYENSDYALTADFGVPGFYETSQKLRGYENLACDLIDNTGFVTALYDRLLDLQERFFENYLSHVGKYVQAIGYADDLGMQDRPQVSPETYRKIIKPYHKKIFGFIHERTDAKILLHSCGAVFPLIGDFIEAGADILNPVQVTAKDMEPQRLKDAFGEKIIFWGGIDEQRILPLGSPKEISAEVQKMIDIMGKNGGYVIAPGHNIQDDTPPENIAAMYEAAKRFNRSRPLF